MGIPASDMLVGCGMKEGLVMPDIALRFNRDMLVLSTPIAYQLASQGFTNPVDQEYVALCEPELIEESYKLESVIGTPCFVTATEGITQARLAHVRFENQADEMARIAYETAVSFNPQHIIATIGSSGLPLDPSSASSLKQSRQQYQQAVTTLTAFPFDAILFSAFSSLVDAQCALMGARAVYDGPLMITVSPSFEGRFADGRTLAQAVALCDEYGADVIGISSPATPTILEQQVRTMSRATAKPLMVEVVVGRVDKRQFEPTVENPYPTANEMAPLAWSLRAAGAQFLRATGAATPAYTGALLATVAGHDVVLD